MRNRTDQAGDLRNNSKLPTALNSNVTSCWRSSCTATPNWFSVVADNPPPLGLWWARASAHLLRSEPDENQYGRTSRPLPTATPPHRRHRRSPIVATDAAHRRGPRAAAPSAYRHRRQWRPQPFTCGGVTGRRFRESADGCRAAGTTAAPATRLPLRSTPVQKRPVTASRRAGIHSQADTQINTAEPAAAGRRWAWLAPIFARG